MTLTPTWLEVEHLTTYRYATPVDLAHMLGYLKPLDDERQQLAHFELDIEPVPSHQRSDADGLGNRRTCFTVTVPHRELRVRATSQVHVQGLADVDAAASQPWEQVRDWLRYAAASPYEPASEFIFASPYVPDLAALHEWARPSFAPGRPVALAALDLMARVHADFAYRCASTTVDTPLAEVFATREGVCQDFAHLMLGALRGFGLAARYVSGYLLTQPPDHGAQAAPMVGADASHAWVSVWCPSADGASGPWLEFDPTNNVRPSTGHVRLAFGRDYGDVTPLRGVIRGGGVHELAVQVRTRRMG